MESSLCYLRWKRSKAATNSALLFVCSKGLVGGIKYINDPVKATDNNDFIDVWGESAHREVFWRTKSLGKLQSNAETCATHVVQVCTIQDESVTVRLNTIDDVMLKLVCISAIDASSDLSHERFPMVDPCYGVLRFKFHQDMLYSDC